VTPGARPRPPDGLARLMLVTDRRVARNRDLVATVGTAAAGGVGIVQVREHELEDAELSRLVTRLREVLPSRVAIVVNGRPELARKLGVGLHLPAAAPALPARASGGGLSLLGRSAHDEAEAERAAGEGVDYVLLGTIYETSSKPGRPGSGPDLVRAVARRIAPVPVFAIGGVTVARIPELRHAGAYGVAACGAFLRARDPRRVAQAMTLALTVART